MSDQQTPRDRPLVGWPAVALVGAAFAITMVGTTVPTPLYPLYQAKYHFGELTTTVVFAVYAAGVLGALLLVGHWSDQLGRRPILRSGLVLSAMSALVFLTADSLAWLFVGRVLSGLSAGIFTGTATAAIVDLAPRSGRARAGLVAAAVNMGGLGLGPVLSGVLSQYAPMPLALSFVVDLGLVVLAAVALEFVADPVTRSARPRLRPRGVTVPPEIRGVFIRAAIAGFAGFAVLGLFTSVSPAFLGNVLHVANRALIGLIVLALFAASTVGQLLSSLLPERRALPLGCVGLVVGMLIVGASLPLRSLPLLVLGAVIAGVGQGMSFRAGLSALSTASPPERRGEITSGFFVVLYVGITVPVIGEGAAATAFGLVAAGVVFAVFVAALAGTALVLLARQRQDTQGGSI